MNILRPLKSIAGKAMRSPIIRNHGTDILTYGGLALSFVGTVVACKKTVYLDRVLYNAERQLDNIETATKAHPDQYTSKEVRHDKAVIFGEAVRETIKLYAAPAALIGSGTLCVLAGHRMLKKEVAALGVALTGLTEAFSGYRERVVAEQGVEKDREYMFGKQEVVVETDEEGNVTKTEERTVNNTASPYATVWGPYTASGERNPRWTDSGALNLAFLTSQQNYANDYMRLYKDQHIFLNHVHDMLGLDHTEGGAYTGWRLNTETGDGYVDFIPPQMPWMDYAEYVATFSKPVILDFNVDGVISTLIEADRKKRLANK